MYEKKQNKNKYIAPVSRFVDLSDLTPAGSEFVFSATAEELVRLASWAGVSAVDEFSARLMLKKLSQTHFLLSADMTATIEQPCVVTLETVVSRISKTLKREVQFFSQPVEAGGELTLAAGDDETPDAVTDMRYDYCVPLLEELSLDIDPYPRKADAAFRGPGGETGETAGRADSPFAVLATLGKIGRKKAKSR